MPTTALKSSASPSTRLCWGIPPIHSLPNNTFETAQYIGNLHTSDRNEVSVAGNIATTSDVLWFKLDLNYDLIQSIGGYSNAAKTFAAMFDIQFADGLSRPDTTISIFDQQRQPDC